MTPNDLNHNDLKYITAMGSTAHTYGNVLATAEKWLLDQFPKDIFKTIHVNSRIAHSQLIRTPHQFMKKQRPMLIISPRVEWDNDVFMNHTLVTERMGGTLSSPNPGIVDLQPFFHDPQANINFQYALARRAMTLDVVLSFDTLIQQMNYVDYMKAAIGFDQPTLVPMWLESYLPREMMQMIGEISGIPVHANDNSINDFLNYMNTHSVSPVTYKLAGSTGKEEFYRYYKTNVYMDLTDLQIGQGENINHVTTNYTISFSMKLEFWCTSTMFLFSDRIHEIEMPEIPTDSTMIPIYADVFILEDLNLSPGWTVYEHASYTLDKPHDTIDYSPMMQESVMEVLKYHVKNSIPLMNFLDIKVRRMGRLLKEGVHYTVDYENSIIYCNNTSYGFDTYTVIISIDPLYINNMIKELFNLE